MSEIAACYLTLTAVMAVVQFIENRVNGRSVGDMMRAVGVAEGGRGR